jgi:hypothetical protein
MGYGGRCPTDAKWVGLAARARDASHYRPGDGLRQALNTNAGPGLEPDPAISET